MEIDAASLSAISSARLESEISTRVAKKTLDAAKEQGDAAVALIQAAAESSKDVSNGGGLDLLA
jgi:hypothetical protein